MRDEEQAGSGEGRSAPDERQSEGAEEQNQELRRLNAFRETILRVMSHDLRGSVGEIQILAASLLDADLPIGPEDRREFLQGIVGHTQAMLGLLADLVDILEIVTGRLQISPRLIRLDRVLAEVVSRQEQAAEARGVQVLVADAPEDLVLADERRLWQALDSLIATAVKYSVAGSAVRATAAWTSAGWRIDVVQESSAMTEADYGRLLQSLAWPAPRPAGGEASAGLGLALVRWIVDAHGGQIGIERLPGQAVDFWITLPALPPG